MTDAKVLKPSGAFPKEASPEDLLDLYVREKGLKTSSRGLPALHELLIAEYGKVLPLLEPLTALSFQEVPLRTLILNRAYLRRVEGREPVSAGRPVLGLIIPIQGTHRLIDGYHRVRWALDRGATTGWFVKLSSGEEQL